MVRHPEPDNNKDSAKEHTGGGGREGEEHGSEDGDEDGPRVPCE